MVKLVTTWDVVVAVLPIVFHSDSKYVINAFNRGWIANWQRNGWRNAKRQEVANRELWEELLLMTEGRKITSQWVRGHSGDHFNELCDQIANEEADLAAQGTGPGDSAPDSTQTDSTEAAPIEATATPSDPVSELLVAALDLTRSLNNRMQAQDAFIREVRDVMAEFASAARPGMIRIIGGIQIALNRLDEAQENGHGARPETSCPDDQYFAEFPADNPLISDPNADSSHLTVLWRYH